MIFEQSPIPGALIIQVKRIEDDRGYFGRMWCTKEFADQGLNSAIVQANVGFSRRKGTLRGMHLQVDPTQEVKVVRCLRGAVFDVVLDLRPSSPTYRRWFGTELSEDDERMLHIPEGCAHGYQTLRDSTEILYTTSAAYAPASARGVRYNDPAFGIAWPLEVTSISQADNSWPDFDGSLSALIKE